MLNALFDKLPQVSKQVSVTSSVSGSQFVSWQVFQSEYNKSHSVSASHAVISVEQLTLHVVKKGTKQVSKHKSRC